MATKTATDKLYTGGFPCLPGRWVGDPTSENELRGCVFYQDMVDSPRRPVARVHLSHEVPERNPIVVTEGINGVSVTKSYFATVSQAFAYLHLKLRTPLRYVPRMSFSLTTEQMRAGTKTVTRRRADCARRYYQDEVILAIEKGQGIPKGERQKPIKLILITSAEEDVLTSALTQEELAAEGFPHMTAEGFIDMFRSANGLNSAAKKHLPAECIRYAFQDFTLALAQSFQPTPAQSIR